jgi:hypothetical protein
VHDSDEERRPSDAPAAAHAHVGGAAAHADVEGGQAKAASAKLQQEEQEPAESAGKGVKLGTHFTCFTGTKVQILTQRKVKVSQLWVEKYRPTKVSDIAGHKAQV